MILITVCRTLFYQFLVLFVGISIGFICNAEWVGWKSNLVSRSVKNIFFPIRYNEEVAESIKNWGRFKIYSFNGNPVNFEVIEEGLLAEEWYVCKYQYRDVDNNLRERIDSVRVRWKTWESYYEDPTPATEEELWDYLQNGSLNSRNSDKAFKLYEEKRRRIHNNEEDRIIKHSTTLYNFFNERS